MDRLRAIDRQVINHNLPQVVCGSTSVPCGQRVKSNKGCRCPDCGYAIKTSNVPEQEKIMLYQYVRS
jgi:tRNA(Ile2) C34 agmatinyltransferase TiaS